MQELFNKIGNIAPVNDSNLEIEVRYFVDERKKADVFSKTYPPDMVREITKRLLQKYSDRPASISQTINFVADDKIKQMTFINGIQQKDLITHYKKKKIINPMILLHNSLPAYRFTASFETPIEEFSVTKASLARIRLRYTIKITDEWQLDITLVKNITDFSNPTSLTTAKSNMLYTIDTKTFTEKAPWSYTDMIEFELEFIGKRFTEESMLETNNVFDFLDEPENAVGTGTGTRSAGITTDDLKPESSGKTAQSVIYDIAKLIKPRDAYKFKQMEGLKQLSNQVIELDKNMFLRDVLNDIEKFYITDKIDGSRAVLYISNGLCYAVTKELHTFPVETKETFVLDCEEYGDDQTDSQKKQYYIFDVMIYKGKSITEEPFDSRLELFDEISKIHPSFHTKTFELLTKDFQSQISKFKERKNSYHTDGIILTPKDGQYLTMQVYKYKPVERLSIDFVIKKCPDKLLGISPYNKKPGMTLYLLFSGMRSDTYKQLSLKLVKHYEDIFPGVDTRRLPKYFPIQFQPSDMTFAYLYWDSNPNLDGEVGEFICGPCIANLEYTTGDDIWKLHKIRDDRKIELARGNYYGNYIKVAELTWMSYKDPLVIENIDTKNIDIYFQQHDNALQKASRNYNSYVKAKIFEQFADTEWVLDLASGKGQDLFRYSSYGFKNAIFLEIDSTALLELTKRKYDLRNSNPINVQIHQMDLNADYKNNIQKLNDINMPSMGVDLVICNFAFHYFLKDRKSLLNISKFIAHYLKPGGRFIFTTFDARAIIRLLNENSGTWTIKSGSQIKYSIRKTDTTPATYSTHILEHISQKIDVLLPFSNDKYYTEYLVNIEYISGELQKLNFALEIDQSFDEFLDGFKKQNPQGYSAMDANDKKYSGLYHYYCFYKKKVSGGKKK